MNIPRKMVTLIHEMDLVPTSAVLRAEMQGTLGEARNVSALK